MELITVIGGALALFGFSIATYIRIKKMHRQPLVCPLNGSCDTVIRSKYGSFLGVPVEGLGMIYYGFTFALYAVPGLLPWVEAPLVELITLLTSLAAVLFSAWLVGIQAFTLKHACTWCLTSAAVCLGLFITSIFGLESSLQVYASEYSYLFLVLHLFAVGIGFGGALLSDYMFMKFFDDKAIDTREAETLDILSSVVWAGLILFIVSGVGLVLRAPDVYLQSDKFQVKMVVVSVIIVNGILLHLVVKPHLEHMGLSSKVIEGHKKLVWVRALAYVCGGISISSWTTAMLLGAARNVTFSFETMLAVYIAAVMLAVAGSLSYMLMHFRD